MSPSTAAPARSSRSGTAWLRIEHWLPLLVFAVSLLITWQLWRDAKQNAVQELQSNFDFRAYEAGNLVRQRMLAYEQVLRGVDGLFAASRSVERGEFRDFVSTLQLEKNFPGIQGVSFALVVPAAVKGRHIANVRKDVPEYSIKPEGEREIYAPVVYIEPFSGRNLRVPGFDNYSNPERRAIVDMARDSGGAVISGKIKLMQETDQNVQAGCLMFLPVYKNGVPHNTLAERRANILGWAALSFRMNDLMRGILGEHSDDVDIDIYDGREISEQALMYDSDNDRRVNTRRDSLFHATNPVEIGGHSWTMVVSSLPGFEAQLDTGKSRFIGYAGCATGILLALLTWLLVRSRTQALQLAVRAQESRNMIENSPDTIARYDRDCRRIYVNPAFGALAEGGVAALLGKKPSECPGGANSVIYETKISEVFATGRNAQFELKWQDKDGRQVCSHIRLTAERNSSGSITSVLGVGRDITELNESRAEIQRKEQSKARFLAAAGHDLRQPLAAASLYIGALKFAEPTPEQSQIIQRLDQAMSTFKGLLDALLNISKLDAGMVKPEYKSIDVTELFIWLEQNFAPMASEKQIGFKLHFPMETLAVRSDIGLVKSVLMNLVSNAIKFTSSGAILVSARRRGDDVLFQVWDTGIGIQGEYIEQIFDEFFQVDNPQRDRTGGLGLGLSIAKRAMTLMGGRITCRSRIGRGSVFEFRLPVASIPGGVPLQTVAAATQEDAVNDPFARGRRFVVVEDDALVAQAMISWLEGMGGEVQCFHSAEDALRHASIENADCYIVDFMLGGTLNGIQFLSLLNRRFGKPINAVLLTGDTSTAFIREAADCDWPVMHKPVNTSSLIACLRAQEDRPV